MKKRLMSTLLMGAFFLASTSMFVSCKDYDDDINANTKAIQNVETSLKEQIATLNSALQQEKTAAAAAHSQYEDAIAKAQAAADAANKSLSDALVAAATHATTSYVDDAVSKGTADKATVSQLNDAIGNLQTTLNAAIDGKASTADLNSAIAAVNDKIAALQGDIAAATNAQSTLSATLTSAIQAVDQKVDTKASQEAVNALSTVLQNVQQSMQTKADVQEAIAAATANLATNASVAEKIQAAAEKAASDVNLAKKELEQYADKAATAAATEAAATAKAEAIASAIQSAQNLEEKLTTTINQMGKDYAAADAQLQKNLSDSVAVLAAKIGGINTNLSSLIDINANAIEKNLAAIENINLQIDALNRFTGLLEDKNVVSLKDSLRITYAELQAAKKTLGDELIRIETKVDENALAYAAALLTQKNELTARIDSLRDNYATEEELEGAVAATTLLIAAVDDRIDELIDGDIATLQKKVKAIEDNIGEASIAAMLKDISDINKTITVSGLGKIENLDEILEDLQGQIDDLDGALSEYKEANDKRVKAIEDAGFISETAIDGKIATAVSGINTELGKYVQKAEIDQFLTGTKVVAALQTAGFALSSDLDAYVKTETLDNYLKKADLTTEAIEALGFITKDGVNGVQAIANAARDEAKAAANENLQEAIEAYDAQLAAALKSLFAQISGEDANGDDADEAIELPTAAKEAIEALKLKFEDNGGLSPQIRYEIDVLWMGLDGKLTSLVFYPEAYYGGIESIEITALKIDNTYGLKDESKEGTAFEQFTEIAQKSREFDLFPYGYAKYHMNPQNASLKDYTLEFIDHTAITRSTTSPYLEPVEKDGSKYKPKSLTSLEKGYGIYDDILWVEFKNDAETFNAINNVTRIPGMSHYIVPDVDDDVTAHFTYGQGKDGNKGIVTALTATGVNDAGEESYVASDYALIVPVTISKLVLANTKFDEENDYETSNLKTAAYKDDASDYYCNAGNKFHLHRKVLERIGDDNGINKLAYKEEFNLASLVETHFVNSADDEATIDEKVDEDLFRRLHLAYRFAYIDYSTEVKNHKEDAQNYEEYQHYTSETKFMTLTKQDTLKVDGKTYTYFNGYGYFNQVEEDAEHNGKRVVGDNPFGGQYKLANDACLGRQPVVRVELYSKDNPEYVYAVGYLKLEIVKNVDKDAEAPFFFEVKNQHLLASCEATCDVDDQEQIDKADYVVVRWDQIQSQLNGLKNGDGLSPKDWNTYYVVDEYDEDGEFESQPQYYYDSKTGKCVLIDEDYDKDAYPYYELGRIMKVNDKDNTQQASGVWTDVLKWRFCFEDYQALYFDLMSRGLIDETTGEVLVAVKRYVKLVSDDSANPDLYIGIEIPMKVIHFPAGTIGRVKNAYWKQAASNEEATVVGDYRDMILNVDLNIKDNKNAQTSTMVANGWFYKDILKNFYGEKILVDLSTSIDALPDEKLQEKAAELWETQENQYVGSDFYFRMPGRLCPIPMVEKFLEKENKVVTSADEWVVKGYSGNTYTLLVTNLVRMCGEGDSERYWSYGDHISIVKINGVPVTELDGAVEEQYGTETIMAIPFIVIKNTTTTHNISLKIAQQKTTTDNNGEDVDKIAGYAQDMLNYARHNWSAENTTSDTERPYNMQLTAFMMLVPVDNGKTIYQPYKMMPTEDDPQTSLSERSKCYILPGYLQNKSNCKYCYTEVDEDDPCGPGESDACFAPLVNNDNMFAVRFYQPLYIGQKLGGVTINDALLADADNMKFSVKNFISLWDWAGYNSENEKVDGVDKGLSKFENFITYYNVKLSEPAELTQAYWDEVYEEEVAEAAASVVEPVEGFADALAAAVKVLGVEDPEDADAVLSVYEAAKSTQETVGNVYPGSAPSRKAKQIDNTAAADKQVKEITVDLGSGNVVIVKSAPDTYTKFTAFNSTYSATNEANYQLIKKGIMDWDEWLEYKEYDAPKFVDPDKYGVAQYADNYSGNNMDGTVDPYLAAKSNGGTGAAYVKVLGTAPKLSDFSGVVDDPSTTDVVESPATAYAAAKAEYDAAKKMNDIWKEDCATYNRYYGANLDPEEKDDATADAEATKHWNSYSYEGRTGDAVTGKSEVHTVNIELNTTKDLCIYDGTDADKVSAKGLALTADNWGINDSYYLDYLEYLDSYQTILDDENYQKYVTARDGYDDLTEEQIKNCVNYQYYQDVYASTASGNNTALKDFTDLMEAYQGDDDETGEPQYDDENALIPVASVTSSEEGDDVVWTVTAGNDWASDEVEEAVDKYLAGVDEAVASVTKETKKTKKQIYLTDLGLPLSKRSTPTTLAALETALKNARPIAEAAPTDLDFNITQIPAIERDGNFIKGDVKFTYNNNNTNTNIPFHIYVPFDVTYNYLDRAPARRVRVWAIITVNSTTANQSTDPTASRRK